jgi:diguanylate cyclase (GGDEF)-like protein/PAS domain S-box-containing protein
LRDLAALVESELNLLDTVETQDSLLRDSEAVLSATINAALDAVVHMDSAGIITRWNNQAEKIFGWPQVEAVGRMLHETIIPPQYREAHIRGMEHFLASGEGSLLNKRIEMTALHRNGHEFPIELSITPLKMAGQYEFSAFIRDITERKQIEAALRASELRLREITELMPVTLFVKDAASRFIMLNKAGESQFGVTLDELRGTDGSQFFPAEQMTHFLATDAKVFATGRVVDIEEIVWNVEQKQNRQIRTLKKPLYDETGAPLYLICMTIDITEHKQLLDSLRLSSLVLENSSEGMLVTDENNLIIAVNPAFSSITGYSFDEVQGKNPKILSSGRQDKAFYQAMWQELNTTGHWQGEIWDKRKNGEIYAKFLTINTIRNEAGSVYRYVALFTDITEKKQSDELIWRQANFDMLTELPNRQMFSDRLKQEIMKSERAHLPLALLLIDLDEFKEVNDTLGHAMGDILLQEAALRIADCVRATDTVARLGGDEFTVVLSQLADNTRAEDIAQKILAKLAEPYHLGSKVTYISASIGITLYPNDATDIESLIKNADQAMYLSKSQGRNRFSYFTPALQEMAQKRLGLTNDLRGALAANQFQVYYQPIVELATGNIHKAEALIRWHHPERGMVSPAEFIPLAEETGLIVEIGFWVFKEAVHQVSHWKKLFNEAFQISVNRSPVQFQNHLGLNYLPIITYLDELQLSGRSIVFEITEGLLLDAHSGVTDTLIKFRDEGIQVALDDFGTGYSALSYLKKFDIDYLKIDKSFVDHMATDASDLALCEAIIVMAHKLGLKVIAEGVETEAQRRLLADSGCDYAQGYLFSKPVPPEEFEKLLEH